MCEHILPRGLIVLPFETRIMSCVCASSLPTSATSQPDLHQFHSCLLNLLPLDVCACVGLQPLLLVAFSGIHITELTLHYVPVELLLKWCSRSHSCFSPLSSSHLNPTLLLFYCALVLFSFKQAPRRPFSRLPTCSPLIGQPITGWQCSVPSRSSKQNA